MTQESDIEGSEEEPFSDWLARQIVAARRQFDTAKSLKARTRAWDAVLLLQGVQAEYIRRRKGWNAELCMEWKARVEAAARETIDEALADVRALLNRLAARMTQQKEAPLRLLGWPVRLDATLCGPGEIWLESRDGDAMKVFPVPPVPEKQKP